MSLRKKQRKEELSFSAMKDDVLSKEENLTKSRSDGGEAGMNVKETGSENCGGRGSL